MGNGGLKPHNCTTLGVQNEAIASLIDTCQSLCETADILKEHNAFLTDTIVKNNLEEIVTERYFLLKEIEIARKWRAEYMAYEANLMDERREGFREGVRTLSAILLELQAAGRNDEIVKILADPDYRDKVISKTK